MIKVVYAIFAVIIKNLEVSLDYLNLLLGKSILWFELLA